MGSSSYISNASGDVYQYLEYFPFGETFIDEKTDANYTTFFYNGKELDEETGLYYYGARYYDPRISMWYGVDPLAEKYANISAFAYCANNPIRFIDPDGKEPITLTALALKMVGGAAIGAGIDLTVQISVNMTLKGQSFEKAFGNVDWTSVGAAGAVGIPGASSTTKALTLTTAIITDATVDYSINEGMESVYTGEKTGAEAVIDGAFSVVGGKSSKDMVKGARKALSSDVSSGAFSTLTKETKSTIKQIKNVVDSKGTEVGVSGATGYMGSGASNITKGLIGAKESGGYVQPQSPYIPTIAPSDATRVQQPLVVPLTND